MRSGESGGGGGGNKSNDQSLPHQLHLYNDYDEGDDDGANDDGHGQGPHHPEMSPHHLHLTPYFQQRASKSSIFSSFFLFLHFCYSLYICRNKYFPQEIISWRCNRSTGENPFLTLNLLLDQFENQSMRFLVSSGGPKARPCYMKTMKSVEIFKILS